MKPCDRFEERYTEYVYGELNASESQLIEAHLKECALCAKEAAALRRTLIFLEREPDVVMPQEITRGFEQGVYRRIAFEANQRMVESTNGRISKWAGPLSHIRSLLLPSSWQWFVQGGLMAASLAFGIWIGTSQFKSATPLKPSSVAQNDTAQQRLARHWQEEIQSGLDEAHAERYLRGNMNAALEQYARLSEFKANDTDLIAQVQVERQELIKRTGI